MPPVMVKNTKNNKIGKIILKNIDFYGKKCYFYFRKPKERMNNMKATGIVRKFDENGRFVLPMELRKKLRLDSQDDALEIFVDEDMIILRKYEPSCIFCGSMEELRDIKEKKVCRKCAAKINILFED